MKAKILNHYISFSESLTAFAMAFSEQGAAISIVTDLRNKGFDYALSKTHGGHHSKCTSSLTLYYNYLAVIIEINVPIVSKHLSAFGEWVQQDMPHKDIYHYSHEIFNSSGFFFKELDDGTRCRCEVFVDSIDFEEILKRKSERLLSKKPFMIYRPNEYLQKIEKIKAYLKGHAVVFTTRKQFYENVLHQAFPKDFEKYNEQNKYALIRSVSFKKYWEIFKPDDYIDGEESNAVDTVEE